MEADRRLRRVFAVKQLTAPAALLSLLIASTLAHPDEVAGKALMVFNFELSSSREAAYAEFGRPGDTSRVSGSNDIYRAKIRDIAVASSGARPRDPIEVFGKSGYYLYDLAAWTMVSRGPIIGPYPNRSYSQYGSGFDNAALNPLTMRSEYLRRNASSASAPPDSWWYTRWRW